MAIYRHMTHVSKHKLPRSVEHKIVDSFMRTLFSASAARGKARVYAILTPTERLMLEKRLGIVSMLDMDETYYHIEQTLNVSRSTVRRLHKRLLSGQFDPLCRIFNRNLSFLDYLELFMSAGLPSKAGPRHQARLDALRTGRKPH